jgi:hypothetical protein
MVSRVTFAGPLFSVHRLLSGHSAMPSCTDPFVLACHLGVTRTHYSGKLLGGHASASFLHVSLGALSATHKASVPQDNNSSLSHGC